MFIQFMPDLDVSKGYQSTMVLSNGSHAKGGDGADLKTS